MSDQESKFAINDNVLVTSEILYRDGNGEAKNVQLSKEVGIIRKLDKDDTYYVETQYGVHYLHGAKLTVVP